MTATMTETASIVPILIGGKWTRPQLQTYGDVYNPSTGEVIGPRGKFCEIDARAGGKYRYVWRRAGVPDMGMGGEFLEVLPPERYVATERFDDPWYPGTAIVTCMRAVA